MTARASLASDHAMQVLIRYVDVDTEVQDMYVSICTPKFLATFKVINHLQTLLLATRLDE